MTINIMKREGITFKEEMDRIAIEKRRREHRERKERREAEEFKRIKQELEELEDIVTILEEEEEEEEELPPTYKQHLTTHGYKPNTGKTKKTKKTKTRRKRSRSLPQARSKFMQDILTRYGQED